MRSLIKFTTAILVVGLLVGGTVRGQKGETKQPKTLRVMTFNIRYNEPRDKENAWPNRKEKVADVIRFHKADLVGVQEALIGQLRDLETLLPGFARCGVGRDDGKEKGEFSAILYRKDRFKLLETSTFWLSETPETPGSKGWGANYARIVTWAKFRDLQTKTTFFHFNTHFDHETPKARLEGAKLLLQRIAGIAGKEPFVVTGDFNLVETEEPYLVLTGKEKPADLKTDLSLKDARYRSVNGHFGGNSSFNGFKELIPNRKIDYIFVKEGVRVFEHGILSDRWDGLWASDHLPVLAEIAFAKK
ncbi:MAG: endonuclease/exonuclease/phosphatase family protein [Pyrinomonadaceae bacterium]